jgi:GAF domain-containing protein
MRTGEVTHIPDSAAEDRWSQFCIEALAYGVRSVLSTPLRVLDTTVGALNLYATTLDAFDSQSRAHAAEFAEYAAGAAGLALRMARQVEASADLRTMLESRSVIDQAVGIVMGQQHCTPDEAFAVLRQASQNRNIKIQAVAAGIIAGVTGTPPRAARFTPRD